MLLGRPSGMVVAALGAVLCGCPFAARPDKQPERDAAVDAGDSALPAPLDAGADAGPVIFELACGEALGRAHATRRIIPLRGTATLGALAAGPYRGVAAVGTFAGRLDLTFTHGLVLSSSDARDIDGFVAVWDEGYHYGWAHAFGGPSPDDATSVAYDTSGDGVFLAGRTGAAARFGDGPDSPVTEVPGLFVAHSAAAGSFWVSLAVGEDDRTVAPKVARTPQGDVLVVFGVLGEIVFEPRTLRELSHAIPGGAGIVAALLRASDGFPLWAKTVAAGAARVADPIVGADGTVFVTGSFCGPLTVGEEVLVSGHPCGEDPPGAPSLWVAAFDSHLEPAWARAVGLDEVDPAVEGLGALPLGADVGVLARLGGPTRFEAGAEPTDAAAALARFDAGDGTLRHVASLSGGVPLAAGAGDPGGGVVGVLTLERGSAVLGPDRRQAVATSCPGVVVARLDTTGTPLWATHIPAKYDERRGLVATAIVQHDDDAVFVAGSFTGRQDIETENGLQTLANEEDEDGASFWIAELGPPREEEP